MEDKHKTSQRFLIKFSPTAQEGPKTKKAQARVASFQQDIKNAGFIEKDLDLTKLILKLKATGKLPSEFEGIQASEITIAGNLHSKGVEAVDVFQKTYESKILNGVQKKQLYTAGFVMSAMEDLDKERFTYLQQANLYPEIQIEEAPPQMQSAPPNQILLSSQDNLLSPIIDEVKGRVADFSKEKVKQFATKALQKGGKKIAQSLLKKGAQKGVQVAVKAGLRVAALGVEAAAGVLSGGVGFVVMAALELLGKAWKKIKQGVSRLLQKITGEKDFKKNLAFLSGSVLVLSLLGGFMVPATIAGVVFLGTLASGTALAVGIVGVWQAFAIGLTAAISSMIAPILIALFSIPILIVYALFIINSGAYVVPQGGFGSRPPREVVNPYINVEKLAESSQPPRLPSSRLQFDNGDIPVTVTYTITITALKGTLTNVSINYKCNVSKDTSPPSCPAAPSIPQPSSGMISPVEPYTFQYTLTYSSSRFHDSLVMDTITVTADAPDATSQTAAAAASICVGDCPEECPSIWPLAKGYVTQGPDTMDTHARVEAIDFGTNGQPYEVFATHNGIVRVEKTSCEGNVVNIDSVCQGSVFSSRYSHLGSINVITGQQVNTGAVIGTVDNTGTCTTGTHLHYEFRGLIMDVPYIPEPLQPSSSCCNECGPAYQYCTTTIP